MQSTVLKLETILPDSFLLALCRMWNCSTVPRHPLVAAIPVPFPQPSKMRNILLNSVDIHRDLSRAKHFVIILL